MSEKVCISQKRLRVLNLLILFILAGAVSGQEIKQLSREGKDGRFYITGLAAGEKYYLDASVPIVSFKVNGKEFDETEKGSGIKVSFVENKAQEKGIIGDITFINISADTLTLENVVPFGTKQKTMYITGKGNHGLSRTHLFLPGRAPVNCIVPDNAWEMGYSSTELDGNLALCALVRRDAGSASKSKLSRFETRLFPGGSVKYHLYADLYTGEWQNGLRKMFQERKLHDVESFDNSLYQRKDLQWFKHTYVMHLMMAWDKYYTDYKTGQSGLPDLLAKGKKLYGGDDAVCLWPTWPTLGIDQRNQFDLFRDLPGGMARIRRDADYCHSQGTAFFICYNPWDESTRNEGHTEGLYKLIKQTGADGVVLDTKGSSSLELQHAADSARAGVIMYSEGFAVPKDMQGIVSGRVHNALYFPPLLNLNKFIKPDFAIYRVTEIAKEPVRREFAAAFFNGYGTELNIFIPGEPSWLEEQYRYLGQTTRILRENTHNFTARDETPLLPTLADSIYVNKWSLPQKDIYTILNLRPEGFKGNLFRVDQVPGSHFVDLWNHQEIKPVMHNGKHYAEVRLDAFNKFELGTNNEGSVGCIARLPVLLQTSLQNNILSIKATSGKQIRVWKNKPDYATKAVELPAGDHEVNLLHHFGRYEGRLVIQLMDNGILLDERVEQIIPGTPRLMSQTERSLAKGSTEGMVKIPSGTFTFKTTHGDDFISYPDYNEGKQIKVPGFIMDKYPVTNEQFSRFLKATAYQPSDTANFLKHWKNGKYLPGQANFPVVYVSYEDTKAYAKWAGKRLPTEVEWQYAAQTPDCREWPWTSVSKNIRRDPEPVTSTLTVYRIKGLDSVYANLGNGKMEAVGKHPKGANPYGLEDLTGSVWQLTNDIYISGSYVYIIMKGGSYFNPSSSWWYVQGGPRELHYRQYLLRVSEGFERNATVGFRCVKDI
ncbi:formylglycine-generating enzyme family protein [Arcticibacter tournemirensis]